MSGYAPSAPPKQKRTPWLAILLPLGILLLAGIISFVVWVSISITDSFPQTPSLPAVTGSQEGDEIAAELVDASGHKADVDVHSTGDSCSIRVWASPETDLDGWLDIARVMHEHAETTACSMSVSEDPVLVEDDRVGLSTWDDSLAAYSSAQVEEITRIAVAGRFRVEFLLSYVDDYPQPSFSREETIAADATDAALLRQATTDMRTMMDDVPLSYASLFLRYATEPGETYRAIDLTFSATMSPETVATLATGLRFAKAVPDHVMAISVYVTDDRTRGYIHIDSAGDQISESWDELSAARQQTYRDLDAAWRDRLDERDITVFYFGEADIQ